MDPRGFAKPSHIQITVEDGKVTVQRSFYESDIMTLYEEVPEEPQGTSRLWRVMAWASAFAWLAVLLWLDRYA